MTSLTAKTDSALPMAPSLLGPSRWITVVFEDDHDLWRMLIAPFVSKRYSQTVSQRLGFGIAAAVFLFAMSLVFHLGGSQPKKVVAHPGEIDQSFLNLAQQTDSSVSRTPGNADGLAGLDPLPGSEANDQDYSFGFIDSASATGIAPTSGSHVTGLPQNSRFAPSGVVTARSFDAGGSGSQAGSAAEQAAVLVPEGGPSAFLFALALFSLLVLRYMLTRNRHDLATFVRH